MSHDARFPRHPRTIGLGIGLDMPWDGGRGFIHDVGGRDRASAGAVAYLTSAAEHFTHLFVSWQPRGRGRLDARDYFAAFDHLFDSLGDRFPVRALHHTALNLASLEDYDRTELLEFTNALVARYRFAWVNEDLGVWSLNGKALPYPLPPYLTDGGLRAAVRNVAAVQAQLAAPLLVEFPGFSDGLALVIGRRHAFDFFRELAEETGVGVTLDTGHLLSYQWLLGKRGPALYEDLERLPLEQCFEIHLSGCELKDDRFHDRHHGVLLAEQLELLQLLVRRCPNVRAITYEDPVFDADGSADPTTRPSVEKLRNVFAQAPWQAAG